ncbi:MAG: hypothetical protein KAQ85_05695 [Thermodesulfovibrionia bacterium]|nr:hypothetical protein [Thermodesulfovibrionia bacterium]
MAARAGVKTALKIDTSVIVTTITPLNRFIMENTLKQPGKPKRPRPTDDVSFFESLCLNYLLIDGISYTGVSEIVIVLMYSVFIIALTVKVLFKWR